MLTQIAELLLYTVIGLLVFVLLTRFYMQLVRAPFRNPIGEFVTALTNWLVLPARRVVPGLYGIDLATLLCAWLAQFALRAALAGLHGAALDGGGLLLAIAAYALLDLLRVLIQLAIAIVIVQWAVSWISPHAPLAPFFNALARPLLRPIQRIVPLVGSFDLSPLVFIVLAQIALIVLTGATPLL